MGQWDKGVPSGWGLVIQKLDGAVSAFRGEFLNGVPNG